MKSLKIKMENDSVKLKNKKIILTFLTVILIFTFYIFNFNEASAAISKPPTNLGLVGYWSFNEGKGVTSTDTSGNKNNGTLTSFQGNPWVNGKLGKALSFDGSNDYVEAGRAVITTTSVTVSAWFKIVNPAVRNFMVEQYNTNPIAGVALEVGLTANKVRSLYAGVANVDITSEKSIAANTWTHAVFTVDAGGNGKLYLNGSLDQTDTGTPTVSATNLNIGRYSAGNSLYWNGLIDEVRIYNRALTPSEVEGLYKSGSVKFKAPSNQGLVGYWSFNEGQGVTSTDTSGNKNNGTLTSFQGNPWVNGKLGKALSFDGSDDGVYISKNPPVLGSTFSIAMWIKPNSSMGLNDNFIGTYGAPVNSWLFRNSEATSGKLEFNRDGNTNYTTASAVLTTNEWQQVGVTYDGSIYRLYRNGANVFTSAGSQASPVNGTTMTIGRIPSNGFEFPGLIDEVRIYNRALSAGEVAGLYQSGAVKFKAPSNQGLMGYWSMNEGKGVTSTDTSGNKNNGTLTNMQGNPWVNGKLGKALSFDGSNDYVNAGNGPSLNITAAITIAVWVKLNALDANPHMMIGRDDSINRDYGFQIAESNANFFTFSGDSPTNRNITGNTTLKTGVWYHLVGMYDGAQTKLYMNGASDATPLSAVGNIDADVTNVYIGNRKIDRYLNGLIDEVRIYNRALSAGEVLNLYNSGR